MPEPNSYHPNSSYFRRRCWKSDTGPSRPVVRPGGRGVQRRRLQRSRVQWHTESPYMLYEMSALFRARTDITGNGRSRRSLRQ